MFLSSASANEINPWGIDNSILSLGWDDRTFVAGQVVDTWESIGETDGEITFANDIVGTTATGSAKFLSGASSVEADLTGVTIAGNKVQFSFPAVEGARGDYYLREVKITIDLISYTIAFDADNELG